MESKSVVIVGAGVGGLRTAFKLRKLAPALEVTVIDAEDCFTFYPAIYHTAAGEMPESAVCIPLAHMLEKRGIHFFHDEVEFVNWRKKIIATKRGESISFDYAVISVGAQTNFYGIPGMDKHSFPLKTKEDAERLEEHISQMMRKGVRCRFVVCGGGLTGVEFASELADHVQKQCRERGLDGNCYSIALVHATPKLLPEVGAASEFAAECLKSKGIELFLDSPVVKAAKGYVVAKDGKKISGDVIVWAGGIRNNSLLERSKFPLAVGDGGRALPGGGILVNEFLQTTVSPSVFAIGDCASPQDPEVRKQVIKTAINAFFQGGVAARNIAALAKGQSLRPYRPALNPVLFTIGKSNGALFYRNIFLKGKWVVWLKDFAEKLYVKQLW